MTETTLCDEAAPAPLPALVSGRGRRLTDKILRAFEQACEQSEVEAAQRLLAALEVVVAHAGGRGGAERRRSVESLVAAHERLWHLRHLEGGST